MFLTTSSRSLGEEMGAAKLSFSPLKGHDGNTAKKQHAGSVEAQINNNRAPPLYDCRVGVVSLLMERKQPSDCRERNNNSSMERAPSTGLQKKWRGSPIG